MTARPGKAASLMPADAKTPTGPPAPIPTVRSSAAAVTGAIRRAAASTGANFDYLLATAKVESNLDPNLTVSTSTATGLFQFLDQTWLGVMKTAGRAFGFERYADAITQTSSGRYVVDDPVLREEMMKLRTDPAANAVMGGVITQQNAAVLAKRIGRQPTEGELYVAHFFGPYAASRVIQLAANDPNVDAATLFPDAARANHSIFYDRQGNARTVAGVRDELVRRYQVAKGHMEARSTPGLAPTAVAAQTPLEINAAKIGKQNLVLDDPDRRGQIARLEVFRDETRRTRQDQVDAPDEPALHRAQQPTRQSVAQQQTMNVEALEHQRRIRGVSFPRHTRQQQHFKISCEHQLTTVQDALQPLQLNGRHRDRTDPLQEVSVLGAAKADGFTSFNLRRRHGHPGKSGNRDLTAASLQHPDASVNGRVRKIVNEVGDLQETAPFKKRDELRIDVLRIAALRSRKDA